VVDGANVLVKMGVDLSVSPATLEEAMQAFTNRLLNRISPPYRVLTPLSPALG
jgi:hypothetical protein